MKIGFIGTGHMGASLAMAMQGKGIELLLNNRHKEKAEVLQRKIKDSRVVDLRECLLESDILFLGVKPIDMDPLLKEIGDSIPNKPLISMAAGISIEDISRRVPNRIIRIMPNTPVAIGMGVTLVCFGEGFAESEKEAFKELLRKTGDVYEVEEASINPISVLTGSAPAYLDYFLDSLIKAAKEAGLKEEEAAEYALKMARGSIELAIRSGKSPLELGKEVCSPGGSTIEGVNVLLDSDIHGVVKKAYQATLSKNKKMV